MRARIAGVVFLVGTLVLGCGPKDGDSGPLAPTTDVVPANVGELVAAFGDVARDAEENGFAGLAQLSIGDRVETVVTFGEADRSTGRNVAGDTAFTLGSITKQLTATLILRLVDQGRLSLTGRLGDYVPELQGAASDLTLHQLLTHTAGLPEFFGSDDEPLEQSAFLDRVNGATLSADGAFHYSNVGFSLAAVVAERETGLAYEDALREEVLIPTGATEVGTTSIEWPADRLAVGYNGRSRWGTVLDFPAISDGGAGYNLRGNGGLLATADAMHQLTRGIVVGDLLSEESRAAMFTRHVQKDPDDDLVHAGYGWSLLDWPNGPMTPVATHTGSNGVFYAYTIWWEREDVHLYVAVSTGEDQGTFAVRAFRTLINNYLENR